MNKKKALLLTLGHNSSALYTDGDQVVGYEQERLDTIKSSSQFPTDAIFEIAKYVGASNLTDIPVFISHWFDRVNGLDTDLKYIDEPVLLDLMRSGCSIQTHTPNFTHHDAHAWSALSFFKHYYKIEREKADKALAKTKGTMHVIVADGFGNMQEVLSVYKVNEDKGDMELVTRFYDYFNSLGLMYQYATSFVGMKENQDEYKFLGYESHIQDHFTQEQIDFIDLSALDTAHYLTKFGNQSNIFPERDDSYIDVESLQKVKAKWWKQYQLMNDQLDIKDNTNDQSRTAIGYFIQKTIEIYMQDLIAKFNIENVLLSGGLFYNVKLNNFIIKQVPGLVSVIPVTGDQGAAIGFYQKYVGDFNFTDLCYGKRKLDKEQFTKRNKNKTENIIHFDAKDKSDFIKFVSTEVAKGNIVNLVQGRLEYGPRALCNTSTLMLPLKKNADFNNYLNKRNDFMPVCPVLIEDNMDFFFGNELSDRVIGSDRFMVLTYDFKDNSLMDKYDGIMHKYPMENKYSGRPQKIVKGELMYDILLEIEKLSDYKAIINTSYNYHGTPINFSMKNAIDTFNLQLERIKNRKDTDTFLVFYNG